MDRDLRRPFPAGRRAGVLLVLLAAGIASFVALDLSPASLVPSRGGLDVFLSFVARAARPALTYEGSFVPGDAEPLLWKALHAARRTLIFAAAAMSLSLILGILLGIPASAAWWGGGSPSRPRRLLRHAGYGAARVSLTLMRSVHELLWAVLFLAAFGFNTFAAVIAIAIPYGGTLAKIFSEMLDEADPGAAAALRASGATPLQAFLFGLLPRALPDMAAYAFYRFECAVRSSAILGFFGYPTLGYFIKASFENLHYGEVWTYLYALFLVIVILEAWSGALRRRFVGYE